MPFQHIVLHLDLQRVGKVFYFAGNRSLQTHPYVIPAQAGI